MVYNTINDNLGCLRVKVAKSLCEWSQEDESEHWAWGAFIGEKVILGVLAKYSLYRFQTVFAQSAQKCAKWAKLAIKPQKAWYGLLDIFPIIHGKMEYTAEYSKNAQNVQNFI